MAVVGEMERQWVFVFCAGGAQVNNFEACFPDAFGELVVEIVCGLFAGVELDLARRIVNRKNIRIAYSMPAAETTRAATRTGALTEADFMDMAIGRNRAGRSTQSAGG